MTLIFSSCQVRLKGPKLLEHSLATMWHQFRSFHQFFLADSISLTLQAQPLINAIYILSVWSLYTIYKTTAPLHTQMYSYKFFLHIIHQACALLTLLLWRPCSHSNSYWCWTQMGLSQYDHSRVYLWWIHTALCFNCHYIHL